MGKTLRELMNLQGRVALVTGGAGQLGSAMASALAELGANLAILDFSEGPSRESADRLAATWGVQAQPLVCDLSQQEQVQAVPGQVLDRFGRLDILVNCAAFVGLSKLTGWAVPFAEQSPATWRSALEVNLTAPFVLTQACAPALTASGHGSVINIGSIYGVVGPDLRLYDGTSMGNPAAYAASKGGLLQLTRWLATVLAPRVRVNAITPGGVWRNQAEAFHQRYLERTPLGRMAQPDDLKGAVAYLASDLAAYVTGHNLVVDGGWTAW